VSPPVVSSLPAVPHLTFGIFNLAVPNIIAWAAVLLVFALAVGARIPRLFRPAEPGEPTDAQATAADGESRP
jgi:hypothetical protein